MGAPKRSEIEYIYDHLDIYIYYILLYSFFEGVGREHVHMCMHKRGIEEKYRVPPPPPPKKKKKKKVGFYWSGWKNCEVRCEMLCREITLVSPFMN